MKIKLLATIGLLSSLLSCAQVGMYGSWTQSPLIIDPLIELIKKGDSKGVGEFLLSAKNFNVNWTTSDNTSTLLMVAAEYGNIEIVKSLIAAGSDINQQNNNGRTALIVAIKNEHFALVKELLKIGADPNIKADRNFTALNFAKKQDMKDLLVSFDAKLGFKKIE